VQWWYGESGERGRLIGDGTKSRKGPLGVTQEILLKHIALMPDIQSDLNKMDTERKERSISHTAGSEVFFAHFISHHGILQTDLVWVYRRHA
jgi:hypothetical protein